LSLGAHRKSAVPTPMATKGDVNVETRSLGRNQWSVHGGNVK
jgi:hypothetical protein